MPPLNPFEQDTFLIMDDPLREKYSDETKAELISEMSDTLPVPPGNIVIRGEKVPFRFLAIVYDVSQEPSWREEWVVIALNEIFRESEYRQLQSLGLQMLGTLHGGLPRERFFALLGAAVKRASFPHLKYLWVIT